MAKKRRPPKEGTPISPATAPQSKPRTGRQMIAFEQVLYAQLKKLAERNRRPLQWEAALAVEAHLRANGLWPPDDEDTASDQ